MADKPPLDPDPKAKSSTPGWLEGLAQRSTGLPGKQSPTEKPEGPGDTSLWKLAGLGLQFAATVVIFALIGREADKRLGWTPWGVIGFTIVAVFGNLYLLIKESMQDQRPKPPPKKL